MLNPEKCPEAIATRRKVSLPAETGEYYPARFVWRYKVYTPVYNVPLATLSMDLTQLKRRGGDIFQERMRVLIRRYNISHLGIHSLISP
jgi:hypothetical protein